MQTFFNMAKLLRSLRFIDEKSVNSPRDYIYNGFEIFEKPENFNEEIDESIDCSGMMASRGWIDLRCVTAEPGEEHKESLESLGELLAYSGFTKAVVLPNTHPAVQTKNEIQFLKTKSEHWTTELIVNAAATKDCKGEDFTDILDLHHQGVNIFGDGLNPLSNPDRLMKVLQYLQKFDGVLFDHSYEPLLSLFGQMHEGEVSTRIGMKGIPNIAEDIAIQKNLEILRYAGGSVHFQTLSTGAAVESVRKAKKEGLKVTADVSIYQLLFLDEDLSGFDANLKVVPPFRGKEERAALIEGLKDGTIDAIVSNHQPQDFDAKHMEFDLAQPGMIGLQTFLPGLVKLSDELDWPLLIGKITSGPLRVLKVKEMSLSEITVFDPSETWQYDKRSNLSLSANHPWYGTTVKGKVKFLINGERFVKL